MVRNGGAAVFRLSGPEADPMEIASLRLEFRIKRTRSLWRKRRLFDALVLQIHRRFNVSVVELEGRDHPTDSVIAVVAVGLARRDNRHTLRRVAKACSAHPKAELVGQTLVEV